MKTYPETAIGNPSAADRLADWERAALEKLRLLRQNKKPGILYVTESGAILVFEGVRAGIVPP